MLCGVVGVRSREVHIEKMRQAIEPSVDEFHVFYDETRRGYWWNISRVMSTMLGKAKQGEPVLITTDDVVTVPDWRERWEAIHAAAGTQFYTLFSSTKRHYSEENQQRGFLSGIIKGGWYDHAMIFIDQPDFETRVKRWLFGEGGLNHPHIARRRILMPDGSYDKFDYAMEGYLVAHDIPWTLATPSLFDCADLNSEMGHGQNSFRSPCYVGKPQTFEFK